MGTSRRWPGPSGGSWRSVNGALTRSLNELARHGSVAVLPSGAGDAGSVLDVGLSSGEVARLGQSYRDALAAELRVTPDCFSLQSAVEQSGRRLVDALEAIDRYGLAGFSPFESDSVEERLDEFVGRFTDQVAQSVGLTVDAVVRRAVADAARYLLDHSPALRRAVETGNKGAVGIGDELFCMIYRLFFADAVTGFLQSVIAAKITLLVPVLPAVDPAGDIIDWIAEAITSAVPTPCQKREDHGADPSLADLGRSLVEEAVKRALGIPTDGES